MGKIKTYTRRAFLVGSAAVIGGVAFGFYMVKKPHANPLLKDLKDGEAALTPWVKIDAEGVTLIAPHADIGQGVRSMQAMLIAEELDVDPLAVNVSPGDPAPAYYNTALATEAVPFMSTDDSFAAETMRDVMGGVIKLMGAQVTGGSSAVPDSFDKLRLAGAVARETLKKAASQQSGVPVSALKTEGGAVMLPDGTRVPYEDLAAAAAKLEPVTDVPLRDPNEWRYIGKPQQRLDIVAKSTGTLTYGIDLEFDGMVHATVKLNPRQGGELISYDASAAEGMRGVKKIMRVTGGVAVVADNTWRAIQAANAIDYKWGPVSYPSEMEGHWDLLAGSFNDDHIDNVWREEGDVEAALSGADVVEAEYRAPYVAHAPLEPISATVLVTDDGVDVWTASQLPRFVQANVAGIVGVEPDQVRLHNQYAGGSFGHRLEDEHVKRAAEVAMAMRGTPVKLTYSREEDFAHDFPRQISMGRMRGAVKDGRVDAYDLGIASPSVQASQLPRQNQVAPPGADRQIAAGAWNLPYALPNFRMTGYRTDGLAPVSSWRSVGASTNGFFADCFLDELIIAAGADPLEERIRMCQEPLARAVLEAVGEMSNWGSDLGPARGRGVAFVESFGVPVAEVVEVTNTPDGIRIDKVYVAAEVGRVIDPVNFDNLVKGGVVFGLGHAMNCEITYSDGMAEQQNFYDHEAMRLHQCPEIIVRGLENSDQIRGIGEPPVPPAAPALANAIFAATGKRLREMPFNKHIDFV
ncbi:xanthine dehydrogenase family protein molybdopterin-binding subunit [Kordiimonas lacus]|uniref:Isoquinoline 1-oxidoreductase, beta subunit n=1 Tax=Kordiimonas lacus TaxID=637679 RepID=A0A1G7D6L3_9PROT|nr:molybdopterin cofactor-binding domain-containing protein [Kordiimonas lacus]SDE47149.1 isoquinoline 1-oxidoreductase, beta subunit [Kordiimonas lacus]